LLFWGFLSLLLGRLERMFELGGLEGVVGELRAAVAVDPAGVDGTSAVRMFELFTQAERLGGAGKLLWARRVEDTSAFRQDGFRSAADWVAARSGIGVGAAINGLETARRMEGLDVAASAWQRGELSQTQAQQISEAAAVAPEKEAELVAAARVRSVRSLRKECDRVRADAAGRLGDEDREKRVRARRYLRKWDDPGGGIRLDGLLGLADSARVWAIVHARANQLFEVARREGRREHPSAYAADALVELICGAEQSGKPGPNTMAHLLVDFSALKRGWREAGETCEIPGVGTVSVATATELLGDAVMRFVIRNGADVTTVTSPTRTIPASVRQAVLARDVECIIPGCEVTHGLEIDHWRVTVADGGPSQLDNLCGICKHHHYLKTHCGYTLTGGPGQWKWNPPPEPAVEPPPDDLLPESDRPTWTPASPPVDTLPLYDGPTWTPDALPVDDDMLPFDGPTCTPSPRRFQVVSATSSLNRSAGVSHARVLRGRVLRRRAYSSSSDWE
jgi:hypothetical protein